MVSPALADLVQLDPDFPQDYMTTLNDVASVMAEVQMLREVTQVV